MATDRPHKNWWLGWILFTAGNIGLMVYHSTYNITCELDSINGGCLAVSVLGIILVLVSD